MEKLGREAGKVLDKLSKLVSLEVQQKYLMEQMWLSRQLGSETHAAQWITRGQEIVSRENEMVYVRIGGGRR